MIFDRRALGDSEMFELRRVGFHEAGHATIAAHFGVTGTVRLQPISAGYADSSFRFTGSFLADAELPDQHAQRLYGLAGIAAESIDGLWHSVAPEMIGTLLSPPDARLSAGFTKREVIEVIGLLRWLWAEVDMRATQAMQPWLNGPMLTLSSVPVAAQPQEC